jgi:hypothetical protein
MNNIHFLKYAAIVITIINVSFLVDPMLSAKRAMLPGQNTGNISHMPLMDLPIGWTALLE